MEGPMKGNGKMEKCKAMVNNSMPIILLRMKVSGKTANSTAKARPTTTTPFPPPHKANQSK